MLKFILFIDRSMYGIQGQRNLNGTKRPNLKQLGDHLILVLKFDVQEVTALKEILGAIRIRNNQN